jgi:hypothetical protein
MLNEDMIDERDIEEEGKDRKRKGWGIGKNVNFWKYENLEGD